MQPAHEAAPEEPKSCSCCKEPAVHSVSCLVCSRDFLLCKEHQLYHLYDGGFHTNDCTVGTSKFMEAYLHALHNKARESHEMGIVHATGGRPGEYGTTTRPVVPTENRLIHMFSDLQLSREEGTEHNPKAADSDEDDVPDLVENVDASVTLPAQSKIQ